MKLGKTIIIGFVACTLLFSGVSYAYWSDTLTMATTATTGEFDVDFVSKGDTQDDNQDDYALSLPIENLKPGEEREFSESIVNHGTVPAKLANISFAISNSNFPPDRYEDLSVTIYLVAGSSETQLFSGTLANVANGTAITNSPILLSGDTHTIRYEIGLNSASTNATQGVSTTLLTTFHWTQFNAS